MNPDETISNLTLTTKELKIKRKLYWLSVIEKVLKYLTRFIIITSILTFSISAICVLFADFKIKTMGMIGMYSFLFGIISSAILFPLRIFFESESDYTYKIKFVKPIIDPIIGNRRSASKQIQKSSQYDTITSKLFGLNLFTLSDCFFGILHNVYYALIDFNLSHTKQDLTNGKINLIDFQGQMFIFPLYTELDRPFCLQKNTGNKIKYDSLRAEEFDMAIEGYVNDKDSPYVAEFINLDIKPYKILYKELSKAYQSLGLKEIAPPRNDTNIIPHGNRPSENFTNIILQLSEFCKKYFQCMDIPYKLTIFGAHKLLIIFIDDGMDLFEIHEKDRYKGKSDNFLSTKRRVIEEAQFIRQIVDIFTHSDFVK